MKNYRKKHNRGSSAIMAVFFVILFSVLAVSFTSVSNLNVQISKNHLDSVQALADAQSGLEYAHSLINLYIKDAAKKTAQNTVEDFEALNAFTDFANFAKTKLAGVSLLGGRPIVIAETEAENSMVLPAITPAQASQGKFSLKFWQAKDQPHLINVESIGSKNDVIRTVCLNYTVKKDNRILKYAIASRSPIIINGDSTIEGDILSTWTATERYDPIELGEASVVNGNLGTVLSEEEFTGTEKIVGDYEEIDYDQPNIDGCTANDFDTSWYKDQASDILLLNQMGKLKVDNNYTEYFPHAPSNYLAPLNQFSEVVHRTVYSSHDGSTLEIDSLVSVNSAGYALFKNVNFKQGIVIKVGSNGVSTNNIRFENCTFGGPVVTNSPEINDTNRWWEHNTLYFTGNTTFTHADGMLETTVLAPNFNVNLGSTDFAGNISGVTGLIVGGIVDVRGNMEIDGSILSIYNSANFNEESQEHATNVGFTPDWESGPVPEYDGKIVIHPSADRLMPMGISTKIIMSRNGGEYAEG